MMIWIDFLSMSKIGLYNKILSPKMGLKGLNQNRVGEVKCFDTSKLSGT